MRITVIGRGHVGGGLARRWTAAGHDVTTFGRDGGDATGADVVVVAIPGDAIAEGLATVSGLSGQVTIDATNKVWRPPSRIRRCGAASQVNHRWADLQDIQYELRLPLRPDRRRIGATRHPVRL